MSKNWTAAGNGTPESPLTWTHGKWKIEKHPLADRYMILRGSELYGIRTTLHAAQAAAEA